MSSCSANSGPLGPSPNEPPLHKAARTGDHAAIRELIARGEDPNRVWNLALDEDEWPRPATPLMAAAGSGDGASAETVALLLKLGADPRVQLEGDSAATFACVGLGWGYTPGGDAARLRTLLDAGSLLNLTGKDGARLLCDVAAAGDSGRVQLLLERGVGPGPSWDPEEARREASAQRAYTAERRTVDSAAGRGPRQTGDDLERYNKFLTELDREYEERRSSAPSSSEIPLFRAAESGCAECVRAILDAGADLRIRDDSKRTAMYYVGSEAVARLLIDRGLPVEDKDEYEWSPLTDPVCDGAATIPRIQALIAAGADVNAAHDRGYTVFMSAVGSGRHPEVLRLLVAAGADAHAISGAGYNAFHAAIDVSFEANAEESVRDTLGYLKTLGVNLEHRNLRGVTPLGRAIEEGTALEVRVLCELGANPNAVCTKITCEDGSCVETELPLLFHAAVGTGVDRDEKTEALLRAGADPLTRDPEGYTPLVLAVARLCQQADDYGEYYQQFFAELHALRVPEGTVITGRDDYIAVARTALHPFIRTFAAPIPLGGDSEYEGEWRDELLTTIELLAAFEGWTRQLVLLAPARGEQAPPG